MRPARPSCPRARRAAIAGVHALALLLLVAAPVRAAGRDHANAPAPLRSEQVLADSVRFALHVTDANQVGITLTNYGFLGNNFISRLPSLEYPLGTGYEHLVRGGLWIGAQAVDDLGQFTSVVTGAVDGSQGSASQGATEFTPASTELKIRSTLQNDQHYSPLAVSEQDVIGLYSDIPSKRVNSEGHRSMGLLVRQSNYMWSFSDYAHIVIMHFEITNLKLPVQNAWVGVYGEFASGPKNAYSVWPPSSTGSTLGGWFNKKYIAYDDSLRLFREHYCQAQPYPSNCALEVTPYWIGLKLLGVHPGNIADTTDKKITFAAWSWSPGSTLRDEDVEKYAIMSAGTIIPTTGDTLSPGTGDPVSLLAVGPFPLINTNQTVSVDFAIVGGQEVADIQEHSRFAQRAFDRNYIVPVPPPSPRVHVVARSGAMDVYWDDSPEHAIDPTSPVPLDFEGYRVYIGEDRTNLHRVQQFDLSSAPHDTTGFNTGLSVVKLATPAVFDGVTYQYKYTISSLRNGFKYYTAVTAYDLGNSEIESLESGITQNKTLAIPAPAPGEKGKVVVFPNPYRVEARWDQNGLVRDHYLWFANLPQRCKIRIYTLSGDLVFESAFDGATYRGQGTRGIYDPNRELDVNAPTLSGSEFGWNLITKEGQAAATGLYLYSVEDLTGGSKKAEVGRFVIVKSDREGF